MKVPLPVRIEKSYLEALRELAKKDNRPLSNYVDTMIRDHIEKKLSC